MEFLCKTGPARGPFASTWPRVWLIGPPPSPAWDADARPEQRPLLPCAEHRLCARRRLRAVALQLLLKRRAPLAPEGRGGFGRAHATRRLDRLLDLRPSSAYMRVRVRGVRARARSRACVRVCVRISVRARVCERAYVSAHT